MAAYFTVILYGMLIDYRMLIVYLSILGLYYVLVLTTPNNKFNTLRRKIMIASWDSPEGPIITNFEMDCTNVVAYLKTFPYFKIIK